MYSECSSILGVDRDIRDKTETLIAAIRSRPHGEYADHDIDVIVQSYINYCIPIAVDPIIAIAQMVHETGNLTSFWSQRPQRNPAGLGVNGQARKKRPVDYAGWCYNHQRGQWEVGLCFASWVYDSIPAHVGRLLAYALPVPMRSPRQQEAVDRALVYRDLPVFIHGSAPILKKLGQTHNPVRQGWAYPGREYGARIAETANWLLGV